MHTVITGGAGLIGSHLAARLLDDGHRVTVIDNLSTGHRANLDEVEQHPAFTFRDADITDRRAFARLDEVSGIVHLACPAAPAMYQQRPIETLWAGSAGTLNALEAAAAHGARIVLASSSDVYGDTPIHPQLETCLGAVDPLGPRSAYQVAKVFTEAAAFAYHRGEGALVGVIRPFNVYGPHMWHSDSRAVPAFCAAALAGRTLTLHGGAQTRSLLYVSDAVDAISAMLDSQEFGPINIGATEEVSVKELAMMIIAAAGSGQLDIAEAREQEAPARCPDLSRARELLDWAPRVSLAEGIALTIGWMREHRNGHEVAKA
ncbi:NAD-dependent epimerase/dehydratase family protein [Nocardia veterana]|uniref:NAD-dependent epimerase/dehydratase family protein n=1 Tax=Nocardia veterana TaxID=132249 RepID=A0A7X6RK50_9NOCA|nr:NAD-dependent epimerase/dehydratase family protein [Nocardia veterana]NKY88866.1 NAD-dependent epimerase/dehydratase family protein [Nocardia veterana]